MAPFEPPKRPEDRNYDEGRFVGWKLIKGVWRPIYEETPAGCFFGALGTFIVLMLGVIIMAKSGDVEANTTLHNFAGLFIDFVIKPLRIILIPIYLIISVIICMYGFLISSEIFSTIHKTIFTRKYETIPRFRNIPDLLAYAFVGFLIYLLVKFALFTQLIVW